MKHFIGLFKKGLSKGIRTLSYYSNIGIQRPSIISISMTNRCNSRCITCSYWKNSDTSGEIGTDRWKTILSKIKDWYGRFQFSIGGGEPLLREDLCEVIRHAINIGCMPSITTNGLIFTDHRIRELYEAGLRNVVLSLNGLDEKTHDTTRGVAGGYRKIRKAIKTLRQYKDMNVGIATVLMGYNISQAPEMVKWVQDNDLQRISFQALFYESGIKEYKKGWHSESMLWNMDNENIDLYIDQLLRLKRDGYPIGNTQEQLLHFKNYFRNPDKKISVNCRIGIHGFFVISNGDVKLCYLFDSVGNVLNEKPRHIWNSSRAREIRKMIRRCSLNCRLKNCNFPRD